VKPARTKDSCEASVAMKGSVSNDGSKEELCEVEGGSEGGVETAAEGGM